MPPLMKKGRHGNWADLPPELTSSILLRIGAIEIIENAQRVCRSWRRVCKDPSMWRKIDMHNHGDFDYDLEIMCRHAVDRSQGGLEEIDIWYFGTDDLLNYIAVRSSKLRSLRLLMCDALTDEGFMEAVVKLPLLEKLEVSYCSLSEESLKAAGQSCPNLQTLKLNNEHRFKYDDDNEALAIAETMPGLRHLQFFGNRLTNTGLNAILDACPRLVHLDIRKCFRVNFDGDMAKRCLERVKELRQPCDPTDDFPFDGFEMTIEEEEKEGLEEGYSYDTDEYVYDVDNCSDRYDSGDD
ncbi:F-box protein SKIP19 [Raphanus sativus]|uniref:F-box protein SKIP19 n=1 Tax=Raphanus sativus TaxID=3726 RepID=A0A6J0MPX9_RAPSA|nr:F-box protein SKIP19 [Raphanus sativus]KAJ4905858.1 F-box protein SKIP19 [Raphanus sativus]